jgi:DNA-binding transcriptional LysR family regulator
MVALGMGVALVPRLALAAHRDTRTVAKPLPEWPDRLIEVELWPDLLRLDAVKAVVEGLQRAATRLAAAR